MGRIISLVSSKGGSGKSTLAVGLAAAFGIAGKTVLLIDADEGARCLDTMLSVDGETVFDISDVLSGNADINEAKISVPMLKGVDVVPSPLSPEPIDLAALGNMLSETETPYDYIIIDTKGQIPSDRIVGLKGISDVLSVVTPDRIAVRNTGVLNNGLRLCGIEPRLIINRFKKKTSDGKYTDIDEIIDTASARLIGIVPEDKRIASAGGVPLLGTAAAAAFRIASRLDGNHVPLPAVKNIL